MARNSNAQGYRGGLVIKRTANVDLEAKKEIKMNSAMNRMINRLLGEYLSQDQISGRFKLVLGVEINHKTI